MKNIRLLRVLKSHHRKELIANFIGRGSANRYAQGERNLASVLVLQLNNAGELVNYSMIWSCTSQGHAYWEGVKTYLDNN